MTQLERTVPSDTHDRRVPSKGRGWEHRLVWLLLIAIAGFLGYFQLVGRVDTQLTQEIVRRLRAAFPRHYVSVDRARLISGQGITIDGLRIAKPTDQGLRDVVRIGKIVCNGPLDLIGLAQGQLPIESVLVDSVDLSVWPLSNGRWNLEEFSSDRPAPSSFPAVHIRSGMIRLGHETGGGGSELICHDLRAQISPEPVVAPGKAIRTMVTASIASSFFKQAQVQGWLNPVDATWSMQGSISGFDFTNRLMEQLPSTLRDKIQAASGFSGGIEASFAVGQQRGDLEFSAKASVRNGRLLHPQVPYPLEGLACEIFCKNELLQVRNGAAKSGSARVEFACDLHGLAAGAPLTAKLEVHDLSLDERLYQALPPNLQEHWRRMRLSGMVDGAAAIQFDGVQWTPRVLVRAKDAGVDPDYFPYPVRRIQGDFLYENGRITAEKLTALAGQQRLNGSLTLQRASPRWLMDLVIAADGPIAIDETLLSALTQRGMPQSGFHRFVSTLHPSGTVLLRRGRFTRSSDNPDTISRSLELTFSECSIKYDGFRYPIADIHGQATLDNDHLVLREFVGRNDSARIKGEGFANCPSSNLESMDLIFHAFDVPLDNELHQALPASAKNLWEQVQPSGTMDRLAIQIRRKHSQDPLDLRVEMAEDRDLNGSGLRGISFRPVSFPYVIDNVQCSIEYRPGRIDIRSLSGMHDASRIQTEGQIRLHSDGSWDGQMACLPSTRFVVDQVLLASLPPVLRDPLTRIRFDGPISIVGTTRIASLNEEYSSLVRSWNLRMDLEEAKFASDTVTGIRGAIDVSGENTPTGPIAYGALAIDAMAIKGIAVTGIQGPFALDRSELLLGRDAAAWQIKNNAIMRPVTASRPLGDPNVVPAAFGDRVRDAFSERPPEPPRIPGLPATSEEKPTLDIRDNDIRARTLSGTVFLSGIEPLNGDRSRYRFRLVDADFHGCLLDLGETHTQASGRLSVQVDLAGSWSNLETMEGAGRAWLRGANLYELPAMVKLFRLLYVRPDQGAFDSADIAFTIDGDRIPVQELQLDGDLVSMRGSGWVNLRRELYFDLYAHIGRKSLVGAMVRPITQHRAANLMHIEVSGTTSDPQMRQSMSLMESFEQVLPESP